MEDDGQKEGTNRGQKERSHSDSERSRIFREQSAQTDDGDPAGAGSGRATEEKVTALSADWYRLGFAVARSMRYHSKQRAFFGRCNHLTRALSAIAAAGTIATVLEGHKSLALWFGIAVAVASALDLVFDFSKLSMDHNDLFRRFADLGIEIAKTEPSSKAYRVLLIASLAIEKEEPTSLDVLNVICANDELAARGFDYRYRVYFYQKWVANMFDFGQRSFKQVTAKTLIPTSP